MEVKKYYRILRVNLWATEDSEMLFLCNADTTLVLNLYFKIDSKLTVRLCCSDGATARGSHNTLVA